MKARKLKILAASTALGMLSAQVAMATVINEIEDNDTFATAQNVNGNFSLDEVATIDQSTIIPHVTILMDSQEDEDFFSFTTISAGTLIVDVDSDPLNANADYFFDLLDSSGTSIGFSDDTNPDAGDNPGFEGGTSNPYLSVVVPAGDYTVQMGGFDSFSNVSDFEGTLNISANAAMVPEPSTLFLFGLGSLMGLGFLRKNKKS